MCRQLPVLKVDECLSAGILLFNGTCIMVKLRFLRERNVDVLPCVSALVCTKDLLMECCTKGKRVFLYLLLLFH